MSPARQILLVAAREMRERARSRAFQVSLVIMLLVVVAVIVLPAVLAKGQRAQRVGLVQPAPAGLAAAIASGARAAGISAEATTVPSLAAGERRLRAGSLDVLVVGARRLEWTSQADPQLRAVLVGAIQAVAVRRRAAGLGISPGALARLLAPVPVGSATLGGAAGRSPGAKGAVVAMIVVLFIAISTYGTLVLTGVVEEKASRVVEVLLSRMPARVLLAGKILGIGLLGLLQILVTAVAAAVAMVATGRLRTLDVGPGVLAWAVVWFVLGYGFYAVLYGTLGSLASRMEDAQSATGPVTVVLLVGYFFSFSTISNPDGLAALISSFVPVTAPLVMPVRLALGDTPVWEPLLSAALMVASVAGLVRLGGRVYSGAVLRFGGRLRLVDVWRGSRQAG